MDKVKLVGMEFFANVGVTPEERAAGHRLEVDVEFTADLQRAGRNDDLSQTADYARVYALTREAIEGREARLIETVAERVARALGEFRPIGVTVRVRKRNPPIPGGRAAYAEVEINRRPMASTEMD